MGYLFLIEGVEDVKKEVVTIRKRIPHYKNLLPGFESWDNGGVVIPSKYSYLKKDNKINFLAVDTGTAIGEMSQWYTIPVVNGKTYTLFIKSSRPVSEAFVRGYKGNVRTSAGDQAFTGAGANTYYTFTADGTYGGFVSVRVTNGIIGPFDIDFENPILVEGAYSSLEFFPKEDFRIKERMKDNGTVQEVRIRFYPGVERTLQVAPYILHKTSRREELFTYPTGTEGWITGDDDYLVFPVSIDFEYDDELVVDYDNIGDYIYTLAVDIVVNYFYEEVTKTNE